MKIGATSLKTLPQKSLNVQSSVKLDVGFPLSVKCGFFSASMALNQQPLVRAEVPGMQFAGKAMQVDAQLAFIENEETPVQVSGVVNRVIQGSEYEAVVSPSAIYLGFSREDKITAFSKIKFDLALDDWIRPVGPIDIAGMASKFVQDLLAGSGLEKREEAAGNELR